MKYLLLIAPLLLTACGDTKLQKEEPIQQKVEASPIPKINPLYGKWVNTNQTLTFKDDGTAISNDQNFQWASENDYLVFSAATLEIDLCSYKITTAGNLNTSITVVLDLTCANSGTLHYTKS